MKSKVKKRLFIIPLFVAALFLEGTFLKVFAEDEPILLETASSTTESISITSTIEPESAASQTVSSSLPAETFNNSTITLSPLKEDILFQSVATGTPVENIVLPNTIPVLQNTVPTSIAVQWKQDPNHPYNPAIEGRYFFTAKPFENTELSTGEFYPTISVLVYNPALANNYYGQEIANAPSLDEAAIVFKDQNFKDAVWKILGNAQGPAGDIYPAQVKDIQELRVNHKNITDMTGLEHFAGLKKLICRNNQIAKLDLSALTLLEYVECDNNQITSLNIEGCDNLHTLYAHANRLTSIDVKNRNALVALSVSHNSLNTLDVSGCPNLKSIGFEFNYLASLDLSGSPKLELIAGFNNRLTSLNLTGCNNLTNVFVHWNNFLSKKDIIGLGTYPIMFEPQNPAIISVTTNQATLPATGGIVTITVKGAWLQNNMTIAAFENGTRTPIETVVKTNSDGNIVSLPFPANPSTKESKNYIVKVSLDGGNSWYEQTAAVTVEKVLPIAPSIHGPATMTITEGYNATQSEQYSFGGTQPITTTKLMGNDKVTWNSQTNRWNIAEGLTPGTYDIRLGAFNGTEPNAGYIFKLTVLVKSVAPSIQAPTNIILTEGYDATQSEEYIFSGTLPIETKKIAGHEKIQWNNQTNRWDIAEGLPPGTYDARMEAGNGTMPNAGHTFSVTILAKEIPESYFSIVVISGSGSGRYKEGESIKITANAPESEKIFVQWKSDKPVRFLNDKDNKTSFFVPSYDVTITAVYKNKPKPVSQQPQPTSSNVVVSSSPSNTAQSVPSSSVNSSSQSIVGSSSSNTAQSTSVASSNGVAINPVSNSATSSSKNQPPASAKQQSSSTTNSNIQAKSTRSSYNSKPAATSQVPSNDKTLEAQEIGKSFTIDNLAPFSLQYDVDYFKVAYSKDGTSATLTPIKSGKSTIEYKSETGENTAQTLLISDSQIPENQYNNSKQDRLASWFLRSGIIVALLAIAILLFVYFNKKRSKKK